MSIWPDFLLLSTSLHLIGEIQAIDASGMDQIGASQHNDKRTNYTFKAVKTTLLINCQTGTILDILLDETTVRFAEWLTVVVKESLQSGYADHRQGKYWELFHRKLLSEGATPVIKYREFDCRGTAHNCLIDNESYHQPAIWFETPGENVIRSVP